MPMLLMRRALPVAITAALMIGPGVNAGPVASASGSDYPQLYGDARNSCALDARVSPAGQLRDSGDVGRVLACNNTLFTLFLDGPHQMLVARARESFTYKWKYDLTAAGFYLDAHAMACAVIDGKPHFFGGGTHTLGFTTKFYCIRDDGTAPLLVWHKEVTTEQIGQRVHWIKIGKGRLYTLTQRVYLEETVLCLQLVDGSEIYRYVSTPDALYPVPALDEARGLLYLCSSLYNQVVVLDGEGRATIFPTEVWVRQEPVLLSEDGSRFYLFGQGLRDPHPHSSLKCYDARSGALIWDLAGTDLDQAYDLWVNVVLSDNLCYVAYGNPDDAWYGLAAVDAISGGLIWRTLTFDFRPQVMASTANGILWVQERNRDRSLLQAFDAATGRRLRDVPLGERGPCGVVLPAEGRRIFPRVNGKTFLFE